MRIFLIGACISLVIALLAATDVISGTNTQAWFIGGVLGIALDMLTAGYAVGPAVWPRSPG
jgi:membrane-bound metal-dependent hydrolase YbcI (DUF457 family)